MVGFTTGLMLDLAVAMSADSKYFASACSDATVKIWSLGNSIRAVKTITAKNEVGSCSFGDGGKKLATSHWGGELKLWDTATGNEVACKVKAPEGFVPISIALSPDGKTLAVGGLKDIKLFSVASGAVVRTFSGHSGKVSNVVFSPDGKSIASASRDKTCKVWSVNNGNVLTTVSGDQDMFDVSFLNGGKEFAALGWMNEIKVFEVSTGKELFKYKPKGDGGLGVGNMAISPDGEWLGMGNVLGSSFSIGEIGQLFNWLKNK